MQAIFVGRNVCCMSLPLQPTWKNCLAYISIMECSKTSRIIWSVSNNSDFTEKFVFEIFWMVLGIAMESHKLKENEGHSRRIIWTGYIDDIIALTLHTPYLTCSVSNFQRMSSNSKFGSLVLNGQCELFRSILTPSIV